MAISVSNSVQANERCFYPVGGPYSDKMDILTEIFNRILEPLYGNQEKALLQIKEGVDRKCFLLYEGMDPVGVLQFKTHLSDEYEEFGVTKSIEIKSLFVDQPTQNSGKGLGSALIQKLNEEVNKLNLHERGCHLTVSHDKHDSLNFFIRKGFHIVHSWEGRYNERKVEFLLSFPSLIHETGKALVSSQQLQPHRVSTTNPEISQSKLLKMIQGAHLDDIHGLKKLSDKTFISSSKDNCLYKWDEEGKLVKIVDEIEPTEQADTDWITALEVFNEDYWLSGYRNGRVSLWSTQGHFIRDFPLRLPGRDHFSITENARRVNCLATGIGNTPRFYVGFPTLFDEYNIIENQAEHSTKVHKNDWVYCIEPLTEQTTLLVTGCTIDFWKKAANGWTKPQNIISEGKKVPSMKNGKKMWNRPFISSLLPLTSSKNLFGVAAFDGSVKVLDLERKAFSQQWREHTGKVWALEGRDSTFFASSGEDRTVKLWDSRQQKSVVTLGDHVGQVTSLLFLNDHLLLTGSCPENVREKKEQGAQIRFYQLRK